MNTSTVRRSTILAAACVAALLGSAAASAAPAQKALEAMSNRGPASDLQLPGHARARSGVVGQLNPSVLAASALELTLADGRTVTARMQRVARDDNKLTQSWIGTFDDSPHSILVLSKVKGVVTGFANYRDQTLEIVPSAGGKHLLFAVDNSRLPQREEVDRVEAGDATDAATDSGYGLGSATTLNAADAVVQDVLVVYTAKSAARYGEASLQSMIQSAVQAANQAYVNSQVGITMNLVGTGKVGFTEGSSMSATKSTLQSDSAVANLRNQLGADVVMLVSENSDYCGLASLMTSNSTSFASSAYGVVYSSCLSNQSLAHEVGHTQGLMHDRESSGSTRGAYAYSYGYRRCISDGTGFRDVMSYSCSGAPRVLVFSNPYVNWNGYPAGVAYESNPSSSAENARTLINTAATVAAFRSVSGLAAAPAAPNGLAIQSAAHDKVSIGWNDNSTNETGFKIERSKDGVSFAETASLGADARSFVDATVVERTTYYYRVRAFNSVGVSGYTSVVSVTTPDVPPPPPPAPASVVATNNGDGTALASWAAASAGVTSFEVRREKWDSRKGVWVNSTTAATVPATVFSIVDSTGAGTYRYFVRALNSGGASAAAGPASVTVTSTTSATKGKGRSK